MTEPIEQFCDSLWETINFYRNDYGLTVGEVVGALEIIKLDIWQEQKENLLDEKT